MSVCRYLIFSLFFTYGAGQFAECGSDCILAGECPAVQELVRSGMPEKQRQVREAICGFQNRLSKVCCSKLVTSDAGKLLPKDCGHPSIVHRIAGGEKTRIGEFPWMVALGYTEIGIGGKPHFDCSGALINSRYVLTAAHCIDKGSLGSRRLSVIHIGDWDLSTEKDCEVTNEGKKCFSHIVAGEEKIIVHPLYNEREKTSDDIGLIRLNISVNFRDLKVNARPICLPQRGFNTKSFARGRSPLATGWGLTEHGIQSDVLLKVNLPFSNNSMCKDFYQTRFLENDQLCVGGDGKTDTCQGDSGGPLVIPERYGPPYFQIGIVSYGPDPCAVEIPAVYTEVVGYREWIIENLKP